MEGRAAKVWEAELKRLACQVPTTGEDDETVEALLLRNAIADKWLYLRQHEATTDQVKQFKDMLKSFLDLHGDELAFAPFPIMPSAAPQNRLAKAVDVQQRSPEADDKTVLPHVFRFLKTDHGVWSVLVAPCLQGAPLSPALSESDGE